MLRPLPWSLALACSCFTFLAGPGRADAACGDGVIDAGELCLAAPALVLDDTGAADYVLSGEFVGPDGLPDLVITHERKGGNDFLPWIGVMPGNGGAGLGALVSSPLPGPYGGARTPSVVDLDGDGLDDLVFVERRGPSLNALSTYVDVWLSNGNGTFTEAFSYLDYTGAVVAGDFDGDGLADYAVRRGSTDPFWPPAGVSGHGLELRFGNGLGGFFGQRLPADHVPPATTSVLAAGDLDGDGQDDLVTVLDGELMVGIDFDGTGFAWQRWATAGSLPSQPVRILDVDDDGALDLMYPVSGTLVVIRGNGLGGYLEHVQSNLGLGALAYGAVADFDGDGLVDYMRTSGDGAYRFVVGTGGGSFGAPLLYENLGILGYLATAAHAVDLDGDGAPEHVSTFRGVTPTIDAYVEWSNP